MGTQIFKHQIQIGNGALDQPISVGGIQHMDGCADGIGEHDAGNHVFIDVCAELAVFLAIQDHVQNNPPQGPVMVKDKGCDALGFPDILHPRV